jgi:segregation and condensation protein B
MKDMNQLKRILEAAIFAAETPLNEGHLLDLFSEDDEQPSKKQVQEALAVLAEDYADRGLELKNLASGYRFQVSVDLAPWIKRLWEERLPRYSRAFLETLVLCAYRQPITRGEIEEIRGVSVSSNIVRTLIEREWVKEVGIKDVPGRPALLATTKHFLDYFGLNKLEDLPPLDEIKDLEEQGKKLAEQLELEADIRADSEEVSEKSMTAEASSEEDALANEMLNETSETFEESKEEVFAYLESEEEVDALLDELDVESDSEVEAENNNPVKAETVNED